MKDTFTFQKDHLGGVILEAVSRIRLGNSGTARLIFTPNGLKLFVAQEDIEQGFVVVSPPSAVYTVGTMPLIPQKGGEQSDDYKKKSNNNSS